MSHVPRVLCVCRHVAAKSVVAAERLRRLAAARGVRLEVATAGWADGPAVSDGYDVARDAIVARLAPLLDEIAPPADGRRSP